MGGTGSGRTKLPKRQFKDAIQDINVAEIVKSLTTWSKGKEVICPFCNRNTGAYTADTVALQSAIELLNRRLGKPVQKHEVDITETIQLNADQWDTVLRNRLPQLVEMFKAEILEILTQRALLPPGEVIEGEYKEEG